MYKLTVQSDNYESKNALAVTHHAECLAFEMTDNTGPVTTSDIHTVRQLHTMLGLWLAHQAWIASGAFEQSSASE